MREQARLHPAQRLVLVVDLDERGNFRAHVEAETGETIFEFSNEDMQTGHPSDDGLWLVESGYMRHGRDTDGLLDYLRSMGFAAPNAKFVLRH